MKRTRHECGTNASQPQYGNRQRALQQQYIPKSAKKAAYIQRWNGGLPTAANTKGGTTRIGYIQAEGNVSYNVARSGKFCLLVLTGPFAAVKVNQTEYDSYSGNETTHDLPNASSYGYNTFLFGWQGGIALHYSRLSLKLGYERSLTNVCGSNKTSEWFARLGIDL